MTSTKKNTSPNLPIFLNLKCKSNRIFWVLDQLSSTIAWRGVVENVHHYLAQKFWRARVLKGFHKYQTKAWFLTKILFLPGMKASISPRRRRGPRNLGLQCFLRKSYVLAQKGDFQKIYNLDSKPIIAHWEAHCG